MSIILLASVGFLINRLKRKRDQVANTETDKAFFNKEIRILLLVLVIFSSTYMARGIWNMITIVEWKNFPGLVTQLLIDITGDFAPIVLIMSFHYKNFRNKKAHVAEKESSELETQANDTSYEICHLNIVETLAGSPGVLSPKSNLERNIQ